MIDKVDVTEVLEDIFAGAYLDVERARSVMGAMMDGELSEIQAAALLASLRTRGESVEEITGFARAMRDRSVRVPVALSGPVVDTCGTGGTGLDVINVSTTAMFVAAAAGARIAKHGNVGVTRKSGSADVLQAAGISLELGIEDLAHALAEVGLAFLFARKHHPAMRFVAPIRAGLRVRTIFNSLGPLTNPASANRQLMGVFDPAMTEPLAQVLKGLGVERALVVHGDGLDDFAVSGESVVSELTPDGEVRTYGIAPGDVGLGTHPLAELRGGDPAANAATLRSVLAGKGTQAQRDVVLFNAGAAVYLAEMAASIAEGVELAREALRSGAALAKLEEYTDYAKERAPS